MHPFIKQQLAQQRMEELRREAMRSSYISHIDTPTRSNTRTPLMLYLLLGLLMPGEKQGDFLLSSLQDRFSATMRLVCMISLALGLLIGGLLDSKFGVIPSVVLSGVVFLVIVMPILWHSVVILRTHVVRRL